MDAVRECEEVNDQSRGEGDDVLHRFGQGERQQHERQQIDVGAHEAEEADVVADQHLQRQQQEEPEKLFGQFVIHLPCWL